MNGQEWGIIEIWLERNANKTYYTHEGCDCDECKKEKINFAYTHDNGTHRIGEALLQELIEHVPMLFDAVTDNMCYYIFLTRTFGKIIETVEVKTKNLPQRQEMTRYFENCDKFPEIKRAIKKIENRYKKQSKRTFCRCLYNYGKKNFEILVFSNPIER